MVTITILNEQAYWKFLALKYMSTCWSLLFSRNHCKEEKVSLLQDRSARFQSLLNAALMKRMRSSVPASRPSCGSRSKRTSMVVSLKYNYFTIFYTELNYLLACAETNHLYRNFIIFMLIIFLHSV